MTCTLPSKVIRGMAYYKGKLTVHLPKYQRVYECDIATAYGLAYSKNPMKYFNTNIKNKLTIVE